MKTWNYREEYRFITIKLGFLSKDYLRRRWWWAMRFEWSTTNLKNGNLYTPWSDDVQLAYIATCQTGLANIKRWQVMPSYWQPGGNNNTSQRWCQIKKGKIYLNLFYILVRYKRRKQVLVQQVLYFKLRDWHFVELTNLKLNYNLAKLQEKRIKLLPATLEPGCIQF